MPKDQPAPLALPAGNLFLNRDITLRQIQVFHAIVVCGSITKAADYLGLSQPSVSQQLTRFEQELGATLIKRGIRGHISLTPEGHYWFSSCNDVLTQLDSIAHGHDVLVSQAAPTLRIGVIPTLRGRFATLLVAAFMARRPSTRIELVAAPRDELVNQLKLHQLNCVVVDITAVDSEIGAMRLDRVFHDTGYLAVPSEVPERDIAAALTHDAPVSHPAALRHIDITPMTAMKAIIDSWYKHSMPRSRSLFAAPDYSVALEAVASGMGTTLSPASLLPNLDPAVRRRVRLYELASGHRDIVVAMPRHLLSAPGFGALFDTVVGVCRNEYAAEMRPRDALPLPFPKGDVVAAMSA